MALYELVLHSIALNCIELLGFALLAIALITNIKSIKKYAEDRVRTSASV